jgi:predicted nuclease of restriction endonuclease-like (RecB) superfamily
VPLDTFRDPYLLDFLGLKDGFHEVELLEMHKDGIAVAEYWTSLPPK